MTEVAIRDDGPQPYYPDSALVQWAYEARQAAQIAASLAKTSFVPASLRGKPDDITAAILAGQELGLQPMATLRSMDVIQGTPALRAHAMRGLLQSRGHAIQLVESTDARCVMRGCRRGEDVWQEVEWTIQRAAALGLTGKDQWKKQPRTMLVARATGEICRLVASDVLHAMPYAAEEIDDDPQPVRGATGPVTAAEILGGAKPAAEAPPAGVDGLPEPPVESEPQLITGPQQKRLHILLNSAGRDNRDVALVWIAGIVKREVASTKELTRIEAGNVIGALEDEIAAADAQPEKEWPESATIPADNPVIEDPS